jgi:hypothetical protein
VALLEFFRESKGAASTRLRTTGLGEKMVTKDTGEYFLSNEDLFVLRMDCMTQYSSTHIPNSLCTKNTFSYLIHYFSNKLFFFCLTVNFTLYEILPFKTKAGLKKIAVLSAFIRSEKKNFYSFTALKKVSLGK